MDNCSEIGQRVRLLREEKGLTQKQLADALHISREAIVKWESGERDLKTDYTVAIADYFGVTCDWILRGIKSSNISIYEQTGLNNNAIERLKLFRSARLSAIFSKLIYNTSFLKALNQVKEFLKLKISPNEYHAIVTRSDLDKMVNGEQVGSNMVNSSVIKDMYLSAARSAIDKALEETLEDEYKNYCPPLEDAVEEMLFTASAKGVSSEKIMELLKIVINNECERDAVAAIEEITAELKILKKEGDTSGQH